MAREARPRRERKARRIDWGAIFRSRRFSEAWGIVLLVLSTLMLLSLLSHSPTDPTLFGPRERFQKVRNLVGSAGANAAEGALQLLGFCAYLLPVLFAG